MAVTRSRDGAPSVRVPLSRIGIRPHAEMSVAVAGNPNCGKSTLFNRLTGLRQRTANYPGVTVERHTGVARTANGRLIELIDLPGTFALSAHSLEERIAVDVVLGRMPGTRAPAGILAVLDATRLYQGLYLVSQLLELDLPLVVALTMTDAAEQRGLHVDAARLSERLGGVPVVPVVATTGRGMDALREALAALADARAPSMPAFWPELRAAAEALQRAAPELASPIDGERVLIDGTRALAGRVDGEAAARIEAAAGPLRRGLAADEPPLAVEARRRYGWVRDVLGEVQRSSPVLRSVTERMLGWLNRPLPATLAFFGVMAVVFQAVFAWATPMMDLIDGAASRLAAAAEARLPEGMLASLVSDGIIAGVGSVVIFLPQILLLFLFVVLLEDTGYLARAAYLMDRVMRAVGLSGQSVIPMISSFACAVPGIMATRVVPTRRDRIATILAAPFMTCSARLPVYALLIAAFVPQATLGPLNLQGAVLFGLYLLGIVGGLATALLLRRTALSGPKPAFALMLPEFRRPNLRTVAMQLAHRAGVFLRRAGTVIFAVTVVVWALAYFPRGPATTAVPPQAQATAAASTPRAPAAGPAATALTADEAAAAQLERSALGRIGKLIQPVFAPLGWDWRTCAAVVAGFPAREVVIAVLGTIHAVGDEADESTLAERLRASTWPDGSKVFTLPMVLGLLVFYAFCLQCAATLAVIRRETNSWRWPAFAWAYMTGLGYGGALLVYQVGSAL